MQAPQQIANQKTDPLDNESVGSTDESMPELAAPPSDFNSLPVEESVPSSAASLLMSELAKKTKLLKIVTDEAFQYRRSYTELAKKVKFADSLARNAKTVKKRSREEPTASLLMSDESEPEENPKKRPSPESTDLAAAALGENLACESDDEVPLPVPAPSAHEPPTHANGHKPFESLHSILCGYKDGKVKPGSKELPLDLCAELCRDEIKEIKTWSERQHRAFHKPILSALKLVYPKKDKKWFASPFLRSPTGAVKYWSKVLARRAEMWESAAKVLARSKLSKSLKKRIREKIEQRRSQKVSTLRAAAKASSHSDPFKTPNRKPSKGLSSSESEPEVVDLSVSPSGGGENAKAASSPKLARPPK